MEIAQRARGRGFALTADMALEFRHILVPVDFGSSSQGALDAAVDLARRFASRLTLVHVYEVPAYVYSGITTYAVSDLLGPIEEGAHRQLDRLQREVRERVPETRALLRRGPAAPEILAAIDEELPDLIVMGTHGRRGVSHALMGSVAEKVVRMSPVPVLTMRAREG